MRAFHLLSLTLASAGLTTFAMVSGVHAASHGPSFIFATDTPNTATDTPNTATNTPDTGTQPGTGGPDEMTGEGTDQGAGGAQTPEVIPVTLPARLRVTSLEKAQVSAQATPGAIVIFTITADGVSRQVSKVSNDEGVAQVTFSAWKKTTLSAWVEGGEPVSARVNVVPSYPVVKIPKTFAQPKVKYPDPPASGEGANAKVRRLAKADRQTMQGLSWSEGCVPFDQLRKVLVNYIDPDGWRHRGTIIVRSDVASKTADLFTDLYDIGYRFHSIHPPDVYGKNPRGPGADDYASMRAGNTSAFNCRFVVGGEAGREPSPHSGGRSLDINPFENPYVAKGGVYPDRFFLPESTRERSPLGITASSRVIKLANKYGWVWGGSYADYHHFDYRG
jgi:hypothetical protein